MHPWRPRLLAALLSLPSLFLGGPPAQAQVNVQIGVQIGSYPRLVRVPGYPVYYSPGAPANLFFYDGVYWLYADDGWYTSSWYNGPWYWVDPFAVPVFVLRVPVRYYPVPPPYFRPWRREAPPRWGEHWGGDWQRRHPGWDHWDHRKAPPPAPLPVYQRAYGGERYPSPDEQRRLQQQQYRYQPREPVARAHLAVPAQPHGQPAVRPPTPPQPPSPHTDGRAHERVRDRGPGPERAPERPRAQAPQGPEPRGPQHPSPQRPSPSMQPAPAPAMPRADVEHRREAPQRPAMPPPGMPGREMGGPREMPREAPHGGGMQRPDRGPGGGGPGPDRGRDHSRGEERGRDR